MKKINFKKIILILILITAVFFSFLYLEYRKKDTNESKVINFINDFNPFKKNIEKTENDIDADYPFFDLISETEFDFEKPAEKLTKISNLAVAGYGVFMKERFIEMPIITPNKEEENEVIEKKEIKAPPTELVSFLRYVDKKTGNVFQTFADKIDERRISDNFIPQIHEAFVGNNGETAILRYLKNDEKTIETILINLPPELLGGDLAPNGKPSVSFLPENITDFSISQDGLNIFYLFNIENYSFGISALTSGEKKVQVFLSPFTEWLSAWSNNQNISMTSKPAAQVPGFMYLINVNKKDLTKILGDINGLTTLISPNNKMVLYGDDNLSLNIYNLETGSKHPVGARTLPEKCVWNKNGTLIYCAVPQNILSGKYPDSWYQGLISFNDSIWKIDPFLKTASFITNLENSNGLQNIDGIKLMVSEDEKYLFLINKKDFSFWRLNLN